MSRSIARATILGALLFSAAAQAHIVLESPVGEAGSYHKAVFKVGHGCQGSPTTGITVTLPAALQRVRPMPKPGWQVEVLQVDGLWQVAWRGGNLPNTHYDEFVVQIKLPDAVGPLWIPVVQTCEKGANYWSEIPASGHSTRGLKAPAALLQVAPAAGADHVH